MKRFACLLFLFVVLTTGAGQHVYAREVPQAQDTLYITLDAALEMALSESPIVRIADRNIERSVYAARETRSGLLPAIYASGAYSRTLKKQVMVMDFGGQSMEISVGTDNNWMGGFSLQLPLVAPALWNMVKLSALDIEMAVEKARAGKLAMTHAVKQAFYSHLLAKDSYNVLCRNYDNVALNTKRVEDKYDQGMASEFDKLRAQVELKNQRPALVAAETAIELSSMQIKALMGLDIDCPVVFEGSLAELENEVTPERALPLQNHSLDNNPDLTQINIQKQQLKVALKATKSAYLPTLSLTSNLQYSSMNNDFKFSNYNWFPYSTAALALQVPIFSGMKKQQQEKQSRIDMYNLEDSRIQTERTLRLNTIHCLSQMDNAAEELSSNKENMHMAEKAYAISSKQFEVGLGTWLDLSASELALTTARLAYHQSIYNYLYYLAELESLLGITHPNE